MILTEMSADSSRVDNKFNIWQPQYDWLKKIVT